MNTTSKQSTFPIAFEASLVSEATPDQKVRLSEEILPTSLPQALRPHKKIRRMKTKSKRRRRLREVFHFDSDKEGELDLDWGNFFYAWRPRDD